jgi:hypothetical protein
MKSFTLSRKMPVFRFLVLTLLAGIMFRAFGEDTPPSPPPSASPSQSPETAPIKTAEKRLPLRIVVSNDSIRVLEEDRPVLVYRYANVPFKPYLQSWYVKRPDGTYEDILVDSPPDHKHHHGLMYALAVNGVNFWEEADTSGKQMHRGFSFLDVETHGNHAHARWVQSLDWIGPDGTPLLREQRRILYIPGQGTPPLLCWESTLSCPPNLDEVTLSGSHYFGLGMRLAFSPETQTTFAWEKPDAGWVVRGDERNTPSAWVSAALASASGVRQLLMAADPESTRFPPVWFTMTTPFVYVSATLDVQRTPLVLKKDEPVRLRYIIAVEDRKEAWSEADRAAIYQKCVTTLEAER